MTIRLNKVTRDLNVGITTVVEFLQKKGYTIEANPNTKITDEQYDLLVKEFSTDKDLKLKTERFIQERQSKERNKASVAIDGYDKEAQEKPKTEEVVKAVVPEDVRPKFKPVGKIDLDKLNRKHTVEKEEEAVEPEMPVVEEVKAEEPAPVVEAPKPEPVPEPQPEPTPAPVVEPAPAAEEEKTVEIPIDFSSLKEKNSEVYAWIRIPDTQVDYPILQRASDDLYYLDHTIDGAEGLPGSIYTQSLNAQDFSDKNTVIYGHNMRDETMFGGLKSYMDESYMKAHSQILIYTPEHILTYQVFAAVTYDNRHILNSFDFESEEGFQEYLDSLKEVRNMSSYIDSDVEVTTEDKIITLSTCNGNSDQRFLVEAVLVNEE